MSFGASASLQKAIYATLAADAALDILVAGAIFDALPVGETPGLYVTLGAEDTQARCDSTASVTRHRFTVRVVSDAAGFGQAKAAAAAISDALDGATPDLDRGTLVTLRFDRATARRVAANRKRRIDMRFEALVDVQ